MFFILDVWGGTLSWGHLAATLVSGGYRAAGRVERQETEMWNEEIWNKLNYQRLHVLLTQQGPRSELSVCTEILSPLSSSLDIWFFCYFRHCLIIKIMTKVIISFLRVQYLN